jgi:SAM-dependent methyltransferase
MDAALTREYDEMEERHWWSVARRQILAAMLDQFVPGAARGEGRWLDVGCGSGVEVGAYRGFSERIGTELDPGMVERAQAKGRDVRLMRADWDFTAMGKFDCVSLFDVLEHVENEEPALAAVRAVLKDDGVLFITVPAFMSLWSDHDVVAHHFRRYTASALRKRFLPAQWEVIKTSYFLTMLFPVIWSVRMVKHVLKRLHPAAASRPPRHDIKFGPPLVDGALKHIFAMEKLLLKHVSLPVGSSLMLLLRKKAWADDSPSQGHSSAIRVGSAPRTVLSAAADGPQ